ncbi:MAG: MCE family protein [Vicinamibacteraceae bacterium]|nr:MCE family protein [Vicinamibacteraceae bacterium]
MQGRQQAVRVGAFVATGLLLFIVGLFLIGDRRLLFVANDEIETTLTKVTGLQVGTRVRIGGMNAGEVTAIDVPPRPEDPFIVHMRLRRDLLHLVRTDSVAQVQTDGLVGNAFIQIGPGSNEAKPVGAGDRIAGRDPVELADVLDEATRTLESFRTFVDDISGDVSGTLQSLTETVDGVNGVIGEVETSVKTITVSTNRTIEQGRRVVESTADVIEGVRAGRGTLGKLVNDDQLYADIKAVTVDARESARQAKTLTSQTRESLERLLGAGGPVEAFLDDARSASSSAEEVLSDLAEETEALKRNFLLRGFFQRRGFYDIDEMTPLEYREFAADRSKRTTVRLWISADVLFSRDASGHEQLTPEGRARLDLAMGTLLEHRRDSPLIVEGYAAAGSSAEQFLRSDERARLVRGYIGRQFRRDMSITGAIGLASDARESPRGDGTWDGVALALHVPR